MSEIEFIQAKFKAHLQLLRFSVDTDQLGKRLLTNFN